MRLCVSLFLIALLSFPSSAQTLYEWVGGTSGSWSDPTNWSPQGVPAATDTASVGIASGGTLTATLSQATTVAGLKLLQNGVIAGDFDLTVTDRLTWSSAVADAIRGMGTLTIGPDAVLLVTESATRFLAGSGRTLLNQGVVDWAAPVRWDGPGRLVNEGEIDLSLSVGADTQLSFSTAPDLITNTQTGVLRRTGTGNVHFLAPVVNDGLVRVENGSLDFRGEGLTGSGSVEIEPGATFSIRNGTNTQARVTGDLGTYEAGGGTLTLTDAFSVMTTRVSSPFGRLVLNADGTTEELVMTSGFLSGSGTLTVTGSAAWSGGRMQGSGTTHIESGAPLTLTGNLNLDDTRVVRAEGPTTWTGTSSFGSGGGSAVFEAAGTFTSSGAGTRTIQQITFRSTGTFVHTDGTVNSLTRVDNAGEFRVEGGAVRLDGGGSVDTGRYIVSEAGRLEITGFRTFTESSVIEGVGTVLHGGFLTNRGTWRPGASPGVLTLATGWPAPEPESVLEIEIGGLTPGDEHDQLAVTNSATLGGILRVVLLDEFRPIVGDRFLIVSAGGGASGTFDAVELPAGVEATIETGPAGAELVVTAVVAEEPTPEATFALTLAPNPARGSVRLDYSVPEAGEVCLAFYDALGREVMVLWDGPQAAGEHTVPLDISRLAQGLYLVRLGTETGSFTRPLSVVR